jgi:NO-binding membrane sensor protein with MHYT domain
MKLAAALVGPLIWTAYFLAVYAVQGLACRGETPAADGATLLVVVATVLALGALLVALITQWRVRGGEFLQRTALPLTALSILGVTWTGMPALFLPACLPTG